MSHQTGIAASDDLRRFFAESKDGSIRRIKVAIKDEELVLDSSAPAMSDWESDYDDLVLPCLEQKMPCYILYRLDSSDGTGYQWLFICYSPDYSPVRQKMLYAATRATLKKEFGENQIKDELFGTVRDDVRLNGYRRHLVSQSAAAPLTNAEEELEEIKRTEVKADVSVDTKHQTITGLSFPIDNEALDKLRELNDGGLNYVQLALDMENERIILSSFEDTEVGELQRRVPSDHARYHFFKFKHTHEGDYLESIVFIYSMPGYKCSIKERMLYSSVKAPCIAIAEDQIGLQIARKLEVDDVSELTEQGIYDEVHPKKDIVTQKFARPKGPAGRGPKRMTKVKPQEATE